MSRAVQCSPVQSSAYCSNCELYLIIKLCQSQLGEIFMFIPVTAGYFIYWSDLCSDRPHSKYHSQETRENGKILPVWLVLLMKDEVYLFDKWCQ